MTETVPIRPDGLQIDEHRRFQNRFWTLQRIAWLSYAVLVLLAALGLSGRSGPFADGRTTLAGAEVTWPRISRLGATETLTVLIPAPAPAPELTLGPELAGLYLIDTITPRPAMESGGAPLRLAFFPDGAGPYALHLSLKAQSAGLARVTLGLGEGQTTLTTLVLP